MKIQALSKIFLYPIAAVYGGITALRNWLFDKKVLKSVRFDHPIISIGNLSAGGTGKTPHIEYLIFLLQYVYKVATLSRGYGRKGSGFVMADAHSSAELIGDEPRQFKAKFPETIVTVGEDRVLAVPRLLDLRPDTDVILLDDAFQHRAIRAGLSILLTEYGNLFTRDEVIPLGWLREAKSNYHRADIIIVTKCPHNIGEAERAKIIAELKPYKYQKVYFSAIQYGPLYSFINPREWLQLEKDTDVLLLSGIAKPDALKSYLETKARNVYVREYRDHHRYDRYDLENIRETFGNLGDVKKVLVTTEKDAARLEPFRDWFLQNKIGIFVQPIAIGFLHGDAEKFNADIVQYIEVTKQKTEGIATNGGFTTED